MARDRRRRWAAAALALLASTAALAGCGGGRSTIGERAPRCGRRARQKDITLGGRRISADGVLAPPATGSSPSTRGTTLRVTTHSVVIVNTG